LLAKLEDPDPDDRNYVGKFFMRGLPDILPEENTMRRAIRAIASAIRGGDEKIRGAIILHARQFPSVWQTELAESLKGLTNPSNPAVVLADGRPLLEAPTEITHEDIPF
jgi:hypothetical protein